MHSFPDLRDAVKHIILGAVMSAILALAAVSAVAEGAEEMVDRPLSLGITGSTPDDPRRNPTVILRPAPVQKLMLSLLGAPMRRAGIEAVISAYDFTIDDMVAVGLLRQEDGLYHIDFNLLTVADQRLILEESESRGLDLADAIMARQAEFLELANGHGQPLLPSGEYLFILLGCFSLDWDGLDLTAERGWRAGAQRTIDGHAFTPWAKEEGAAISLKGLYWGSHNQAVGEITFTTFGDHVALPRFGIPDMMWDSWGAFRRFKDRSEAVDAAVRAISPYKDDAVGDMGRILFALRGRNLSAADLSGETNLDSDRLERLLALLEAAEYVSRIDGLYGARAVVLVPSDKARVDALVALGRETMTAWHEANYGDLREALAGLEVMKAGVPFERVYTEVWHFIFGSANRTLVERGLFADPYAETRAHPGFMPVVWAVGIDETP